ncbi:MAG: Nif3-like dinuclear metal center hexameric protein [Planctomycetota bacterium]|nr:Nif3-like dinuclear metal center hexameric protein [Planctomycetota bacterium]
MQLSKVVESLEKLAPVHLAEPWDNVGLLAGDPDQKISRILLTIDYTPSVAAEAADAGCDLVVAYHPPIFAPLKRLAPPSLVFDAIRRGIAIYSPHTALDAAEGGTNDMLADAIGMSDRGPLRVGAGKATQYKLTVFVPEEKVDQVGQALFEAGAGRIGNYTSCSFRNTGTGTFFGQEGTNPAVGQSGRLERVPEVRLETVVPISKVSAVVYALRKSHPYEEPAFDLNVLAARPQATGMGRIGKLAAIARQDLLARIKRELQISHLLVAGPTGGNITRAAVCAGACGEFLDEAIAGGAQLYLTGEMRHHDAIKAARAGVTVVCTLHSNSERAVLKRVLTHLSEILGMPPVVISAADHDPFTIL